nr:MAG TPA: hypothetical protein [Bacteriophage sp.]
MCTSLEDEIRAVVAVMRRQNREIKRFILKEDSMKVTKCTGKSKPPKFDMKTLNKNLIR